VDPREVLRKPEEATAAQVAVRAGLVETNPVRAFDAPLDIP
jgi:hypothetical protein